MNKVESDRPAETDPLRQLSDLQKELDEAINNGAQMGNLSQAQILKRQIQAKLKETFDNLRPSYQVLVHYDLSIKEIINRGHYWCTDSINDHNYPSPESGKKIQKIYLFHFQDYVTGEAVFKKMKEQNFRPATLKEVLFLGLANPDIYNNDRRVVALGSTWFSNLKHYNVPLIRNFSGPYITDQHLDDRFSPLNYFAAIHQ